ncbi:MULTISPECIES: signal peptidase II [unclassified Streptomyces]|uniref:signal peptidase II n=1 Tax=unclassified Streptomyces TaxID=2593676 RepID=UPI003D8EA8EA
MFAWRMAPRSRAAAAALALVVGGAAANLADRAADGVVTDYLATGWWPTFNLCDIFIVTGGLTVAALSWRRPPTTRPRPSDLTPSGSGRGSGFTAVRAVAVVR